MIEVLAISFITGAIAGYITTALTTPKQVEVSPVAQEIVMLKSIAEDDNNSAKVRIDAIRKAADIMDTFK